MMDPHLTQSIEKRLEKLKPLVDQLKKRNNIKERLEILDQISELEQFLEAQPKLKDQISKFNQDKQYILKSLLVLGQGDIVFQNLAQYSHPEPLLNELLDKLEPVEKFYDLLGGVIGYHVIMLQLILEKMTGEVSEDTKKNREHYLKPVGYDLVNDSNFIHKAIRNALENMSLLAEIYPVGGAGERLKLQDENTKEDLPAAELLYQGRTLLEGLIRDLQAREYLYFKLFEKQVVLPIAMMTSDEKNNHEHILSICQQHDWFGRSKDLYLFFKQPLVPMLTEEGNWAVSEPMKPFFKPGGHGVLWKLALDSRIIDELLDIGSSKALVRQINNPIAGTDYGLLAFCGCGFLNNHDFGFASCPRLLNTAEGMNVLIERKSQEEYEYCISNIEYPDFEKKHIKDVSEKPGSPFSAFPANTNLLFCDLKSVIKAVEQCSVPGMLINMKTKVSSLMANGKRQEIVAGRLESLMQNLADVITDKASKPIDQFHAQDLRTFLTYNKRSKTISVTKKLYVENQPIVETPEGCFYDQLVNHYDLFTNYCQMKLPALCSENEYLQNGPSFVTAFHPALGPLYSVIAQKIQGGSLTFGADMILEIAELQLQRVDVNGSLQIFAENIMGHKNSQGLIQYSEKVGRCILRNVKINNRGINRNQTHQYWKGNYVRYETLKITLKGLSEFIAEDVTFSGNVNIEVPDGYRVIARQSGEKIELIKERIDQPSWHWKYSFDGSDRIVLISRHPRAPRY